MPVIARPFWIGVGVVVLVRPIGVLLILGLGALTFTGAFLLLMPVVAAFYCDCGWRELRLLWDGRVLLDGDFYALMFDGGIDILVFLVVLFYPLAF